MAIPIPWPFTTCANASGRYRVADSYGQFATRTSHACIPCVDPDDNVRVTRGGVQIIHDRDTG